MKITRPVRCLLSLVRTAYAYNCQFMRDFHEQTRTHKQQFPQFEFWTEGQCPSEFSKGQSNISKCLFGPFSGPKPN